MSYVELNFERLAMIAALVAMAGAALFGYLGTTLFYGPGFGLLLGIAAWIVGAVVTGGAWSKIVAGLDEAGRGPLAGPVVAACVVLPPGTDRRTLRGLDDSKRLSARLNAIRVMLQGAGTRRRWAWTC